MTVPLCSRPDDTRPSLCKSLLCVSLCIQRRFCAGVWPYNVSEGYIKEMKSVELIQSGWRAADPLKMELNLFLCQECWHKNDQIEYLGNTQMKEVILLLLKSAFSLKTRQMLMFSVDYFFFYYSRRNYFKNSKLFVSVISLKLGKISIWTEVFLSKSNIYQRLYVAVRAISEFLLSCFSLSSAFWLSRNQWRAWI